MPFRILGFLFWTAVSLWLILLLAHGGQDAGGGGEYRISYSAFLDEVANGRIAEVTLQEQEIRGSRTDGGYFETYLPEDPGLIGDLLNGGVTLRALAPDRPGLLMEILLSWFPLLLLAGVWVWFLRRNLGGNAGNNGLFQFGKSRAKRHAEEDLTVTFADVAGVEEAKEEVAELVEFLRRPQKFSRLGGRIPRGLLMVGPPGTGKTLLARSIAGEAKVPFFSVSGSDFVEMFVGVGASRVRDLFAQAKKQTPCILFVDEIDAVGRRRGAGLGGGHDEREQTLNQLLVEMDGFAGNEGLLVLAATNRPDVLDPALRRPGRFDRQVVVALPDLNGREAILRVHLRRVPVAANLEVRTLARGTPGFSGADLANLVNEAALLAARANLAEVGMEWFEKAKDKILMGTERRSLILSDHEKRLTAYHEAGHCIVGRLVPEHDPVHKISILPRGRALGITLFLPERDHHSLTRRQLESRLSTLFAGRLAEEMIFGSEAVTTGAANDLQRATAIARDMVTRHGLSEALGPLAYAEDGGEVFLGRAIARRQRISATRARAIDLEVRALAERNYRRARQLLEDHLDRLHAMAAALLRHETLSLAQIEAIMAGQALDSPEAAGSGDPVGGLGDPRSIPAPVTAPWPGNPECR